jgi:hypothetical protein
MLAEIETTIVDATLWLHTYFFYTHAFKRASGLNKHNGTTVMFVHFYVDLHLTIGDYLAPLSPLSPEATAGAAAAGVKQASRLLVETRGFTYTYLFGLTLPHP